MIHVESAKQSLSSFSISSSLAAAAQKIGSTVSLESDWSDGKVCAPNQLVPKYAILLLLALIGVIATILSSNRMLNDFSVSSIDDSSILWTDHAVRMDVIELSKTHAEPPSNVTAAICFKTLFGDIDLGIVIQWAAYNVLLGFDRIFMFYRPEVKLLPRWDELYNLPYIVLTEQTKGTRNDYYNQAETEIMCLQEKRFAALYDWVLVADIDEYLWFAENIGVKEFLQRHNSMTYLSFGKQMHSLSNRVDSQYLNLGIQVNDSSSFAVSHYPFYMKHYCTMKIRKNNPICPMWWGRAKVMVRPTFYGNIKVHGVIHYDQFNESSQIHFHPSVAHFKEWPEIFNRHNVAQREPKPFEVGSEPEVHIHNMHTGFKPIGGDGGKFLVWEGRWQVEYDPNLDNWFEFVIGRAVTGKGTKGEEEEVGESDDDNNE